MGGGRGEPSRCWGRFLGKGVRLCVYGGCSPLRSTRLRWSPPAQRGKRGAKRRRWVEATPTGGGQEGLGAWEAPCRVSPGLASSWPSPAGSRSWWYFSCLARIRSILRGAAQAAPELPKAPRDPSAMPGCRALGGGHRGLPGAPPKPTHCRLSWARDFFSACRWERMLFRMLALNSATPLRGWRW